MKKIYLLKGDVHSGKTTRLLSWIEQNKNYSSFSGVLSPAINKKRYFRDISSGEIFPMEFSGSGASINAGKYSFSEIAFEKARSILYSAKTEWVIVDEFGLLELRNEGLNPAVSKLINSPYSKNLLIVIRNKIVDEFLRMYSFKHSDVEWFNFTSLNSTGIILAGGRSSRMGKEKALLKFGETTIIEHLLYQLKQVCFNLFIISNTPDKFTFTGVKNCPDIIPGFGPLSGIHSALINSGTTANLIVSCDMPFLSYILFLYLLRSVQNKKCLMLKYEDKIQPFPGIYTKQLIPVIEDFIKKNPEIRKSIPEIIKCTDPDILKISDSTPESSIQFFNINTPEDYKTALEIYKIKPLF